MIQEHKMKTKNPAHRLGSIMAPLFVLTIYIIITFIYFIPPGTSLTTAIFSPSPDPYIGIWSMNWWPFAIKNELNLFLTNYIWYPSGFNLAWAGAMPSLALLGFPITKFFGAIVSYNILALSVYPLAAWNTYILAHYLTRNYLASLLAGYSFGFSSYILGQSLAHIVLSFVCLIPITILLSLKRFRGEIKRGAFIALLAISIALEFGIYMEVAATATFFATAYFAIFYFFNAEHRQILHKLSLEIIGAFFVATLILAPYLFYVVRGLSFTPGVINSPTAFSADLFNYFIPTPLTLIGGSALTSISSHFTGNFAETGAYLGILLIVIAALSLRDNLKSSWGKPLLYTTLFILICSLGPFLQIGGINTHIPMPWKFFEKIPLLGHALPTRFTLYTSLIASILLAFWLNRSGLSIYGKLIRYVLAICALAMIFPALKAWPWGAINTPRFFTDTNLLSKYIKRGDTVVVLPYGSQGNSMLWQYQSGMYFRMAGGYVGFTPKAFIKSQAVNIFFNTEIPTEAADIRNVVSSFCAGHSVKAIIVGPGTSQALLAAMQKLQWQHQAVGGVDIIQVPPAKDLKYSDVQGDYWQSVYDWAWMGKTITISNHGLASVLYVKSEWMPAAVGPITLTIQTNGKVDHLVLTPGQKDNIAYKIGAFSTATITANKTWIPADVIHNGDLRKLSVLFEIGS